MNVCVNTKPTTEKNVVDLILSLADLTILVRELNTVGKEAVNGGSNVVLVSLSRDNDGAIHIGCAHSRKAL